MRTAQTIASWQTRGLLAHGGGCNTDNMSDSRSDHRTTPGPRLIFLLGAFFPLERYLTGLHTATNFRYQGRYIFENSRGGLWNLQRLAQSLSPFSQR
ncbi:protein adenylyltransferase SelO family protein [Klebsiella pneumoniae]|nr:protein adenylyltransferase SelO family protein [Klebsiella pneumoniae]